MKFILKKIRTVLLIIMRIFPINNKKILFSNFGGKGYGENPKYIAEELHKLNPGLKLIWVSNNKNNKFPEYIIPVKTRSIKLYYHLTTSKVIINNIRTFFGGKKRKGQIYIQTWHGGEYPTKKIEQEIENLLDPEYIKLAKYDGQITNAIITGNKFVEEQYKKYFWLNENTEILRTGLPRTDFLINNKNNEQLKEKIKLKIFDKNDMDSIIILYIPTFRDDKSLDGYKIDFTKVIDTFRIKLKRKCKILYKLHPNVSNSSEIIPNHKDIINVSNYSDIQELILISDYAISDYSSAIFDAALLDKICFICALDIESYNKSNRLSEEFFNSPFSMAYSNDELINQIENFNQEEYKKKAEKYFKRFPSYDKGDASKKVAEWILENMK